MNAFKIPKVEYKNCQEWYTARDKSYAKIKKVIHKWVVEDTFEHEHMHYQGLTSRQNINISWCVENELNKLTKNQSKEWSQETAFYIIYGIEASYNGFIDAGVWNWVYAKLSSRDLAKQIYCNITWQLDSDSRSPTIMEDVVVYTDTDQE
jgi:hypothetical protein